MITTCLKAQPLQEKLASSKFFCQKKKIEQQTFFPSLAWENVFRMLHVLGKWKCSDHYVCIFKSHLR
jgi:hypothetical protein